MNIKGLNTTSSPSRKMPEDDFSITVDFNEFKQLK